MALLTEISIHLQNLENTVIINETHEKRTMYVCCEQTILLFSALVV